MNRSQEGMTRREFLERVFIVILPIILAITALVLALSVYDIADSPGGDYDLLLLILLLATLAYPALRKRYGQRLWNSLPPSIRRLGLLLKIVFLLLEAAVWLLIGLRMPLLLFLACIALMVENYWLRRDLEALQQQAAQF